MKRSQIMALSGLVLTAGVLALIALALTEPSGPEQLDRVSEGAPTAVGGIDKPEHQAAAHAGVATATTRHTAAEPTPTASSRVGTDRAPTDPAGARDDPQDDDPPTAPAAEGDAPSEVAALDPLEDWTDETNRAVLGPREWMAPVADQENERIDEVFAKARASDPSAMLAERRSSIDAVKPVVQRCFDALKERQPAAQGRFIMQWEAHAGTVSNPRISTNYRLRDPQFVGCVTSSAASVRYESAGSEQRTIEYAFIFDSSM